MFILPWPRITIAVQKNPNAANTQSQPQAMNSRIDICVHVIWNILGLQVVGGWTGPIVLQSCSVILLGAVAGANWVTSQPDYVEYFARFPASVIVIWAKFGCLAVAVFSGLGNRRKARHLAAVSTRLCRATGVSLETVRAASAIYLGAVWLVLILFWLARADWFGTTSALANMALFGQGTYLFNTLHNSRLQFKSINKELKTSLKASAGRQNLSSQSWKSIHSHSNACEQAAKLNNFLGLHTLSQVVFSFTQILTTLYMAIVTAQHSKEGADHVRTCFIYTHTEWALFHILHVVHFLHIVIAFQKIYTEAKKPVSIFISEWIVANGSIDRNEVDIVLLKLHQHNIRYSAWDLLTVDMKLVTRVASAIIVYLTILMQFQDQAGCHYILKTTEK